MAAGRRSHSATISKLERQQLALDYRKAGLTYRAIAAKIRETGLSKYSETLAHRDVKDQLAVISTKLSSSAEELRSLELARLDSCWSTLWRSIGQGDTKAITAAVRISERRSKLLGLDAPIEVKIQAQAEAIAIGEFNLLLERLSARPDFPRESLEILLQEAEGLGDRAAQAEDN